MLWFISLELRVLQMISDPCAPEFSPKLAEMGSKQIFWVLMGAITCSLQQMQRYLYKASLYLYCINNYHSKYYNVSTHHDTRRLSLHELIHSSSFGGRYCRTSRISFHCTLNCWGLSELFFGNSFFRQCKRFDSILKLCLSGWPWPFPARFPF